jgi:YD repeat-containing protein
LRYSYEYDGAGRVTRQILPDASEINFGYYANGNMTSITPPGKPTHSFIYTKVNQEETYNPPALDSEIFQTWYEYTLDRQLSKVTRPDGNAVQFDYDSRGKLDLITVPDDQKIDYEYGAETGHLTTITAPGGETLGIQLRWLVTIERHVGRHD